ncbi:hypothetical protein [Microbispora amethystogenes]|uniref:Gram-positive cocci surface proteins LPxTG domain-containing protein n=1 Tax=Microbispora amethystogenes TaxID=1427754 RepID=A0ABQ4FC59_9ACTN|nr:hypothetical protein [Microbispora amethystogenes]GIH32417.1 hypothetical protein Mam01_25810 [Microbispora amethystogenes]
MVAGGLALGIPGAAAAESVGFTVLPSGDGVYPPRPVSVENVVDPGIVTPAVQENEPAVAQPVCQGNACNNNQPVWWGGQPIWGGNGPGVWTTNETKNGNAPVQPVVAPLGGAGGEGTGPVQPLQNAAQQSEALPAGAAESEEVPEERADEKADEEEDMPAEEESEGFPEEEAGPPMAGAPAGEAPTEAGPGGGTGGGPLPFTGAPAGVAVAGAGLLVVALGYTLLSAWRRRSGDAG